MHTRYAAASTSPAAQTAPRDLGRDQRVLPGRCERPSRTSGALALDEVQSADPPRAALLHRQAIAEAGPRSPQAIEARPTRASVWRRLARSLIAYGSTLCAIARIASPSGTDIHGNWFRVLGACENGGVASVPKRIMLSEPGVAGSYELVERRADGSLVLRPEHERLSDVMRETEGQVFRDEEFVAHLERVAAAEDDLPADSTA
jgi:hypothetical protein